eukprot:TRINITY_DN8003_c0_g1_i1.p3 TRINITY_DN8003_c0_g1~~TRINITY_DN8003_c0_g1_i1.p3  ORF type:complete len:114 (+),score=24.26 TRINITY_DN8003_c0_g1_i1:1191-1532(+)
MKACFLLSCGCYIPFCSLNGNPANPFCHGVPGIEAAYQQAITNVQLWGPTNFAPIINHVAGFAEQATNAYYVLLILTDGVITDIDNTKHAIVMVGDLWECSLACTLEDIKGML